MWIGTAVYRLPTHSDLSFFSSCITNNNYILTQPIKKRTVGGAVALLIASSFLPPHGAGGGPTDEGALQSAQAAVSAVRTGVAPHTDRQRSAGCLEAELWRKEAEGRGALKCARVRTAVSLLEPLEDGGRGTRSRVPDGRDSSGGRRCCCCCCCCCCCRPRGRRRGLLSASL